MWWYWYLFNFSQEIRDVEPLHTSVVEQVPWRQINRLQENSWRVNKKYLSVVASGIIRLSSHSRGTRKCVSGIFMDYQGLQKWLNGVIRQEFHFDVTTTRTCLLDFWCCLNKWSKIAPYSSWILCISLMCSATFSIPIRASIKCWCSSELGSVKFCNKGSSS